MNSDYSLLNISLGNLNYCVSVDNTSVITGKHFCYDKRLTVSILIITFWDSYRSELMLLVHFVVNKILIMKRLI